jgi:hypothetical protein
MKRSILGFASVVSLLTLCLAVNGCKSGGGSGSAVSGSDPGGGGGNPTFSIALVWAEPSTNDDGSALSDLEGYNLYYGTSSGNYSHVLDVGAQTQVNITDLAANTYYFAVSAYDDSGNESGLSNEVAATLQ